MNGAELIRAARITYRQLDYWTTARYLRAAAVTRHSQPQPLGMRSNPGSGHERTYDAAEVTVATRMGILVRAGLAPAAAAVTARRSVVEDRRMVPLGTDGAIVVFPPAGRTPRPALHPTTRDLATLGGPQ